MPRRQLRNVDPRIDLSRHFRTAEELPPQFDPQGLFGNGNPVELEIGTGKGLFLATASAARSDHNFIGVEIAGKYARHAALRQARAGRTNALVISGDAGPLVASWFPDQSLSAVHVYFPDPWWKKRHKQRRVVNEKLLRGIVRVLKSGGYFHFWTDVLDYFQTTMELIGSVAPQLGVPVPEEELPADHDLDYRTHFERSRRQDGIPVYRVRFEKNAAAPLLVGEN